MTDTSLVQGEFAPADTSFAADISVQSSPLDAVVSAVEADAAVTAEPNGFIELGLAPELVQAVADLSDVAWAGVSLGDQGYAVVKVEKVLPRAKRDAAVPNQEVAQYTQWWTAAESQAYYEMLKEQFRVKLMVPAPAPPQR